MAFSACAAPALKPSPRRSFFAALSEEGEVAHGRRPWADPKVHTVRLTTHSWRWPLDRVRVTSTFGERSGTFHEGVDLQAPVGTSVYAAEEGRVAFAGGRIGSYGRTVILKHPRSGLLSVYAHLQRPLVKEGQWVSRGQKVAVSGQSGRASGPHLHFEIREGVTAIDPAQVMPPAEHVRGGRARRGARDVSRDGEDRRLDDTGGIGFRTLPRNQRVD